jgi:PAS domain S-box-containing protein
MNELKVPLRVLIAEDNASDAELVLRELRRAGFEPKWERVDNEAAFLDQIGANPDIILSDYEMPQFSGPRALELLHERGLDIPFIIISGTIGEDIAISAMKQGADDYLLKDRLTRLGPAIHKALELARTHKESKQAVEDLRLFRALVDQSSDAFEVIDPESARFLDVNEQGPAELGYTRADYLALRVIDIDPTMTESHWRHFVEKIRIAGSASGEGCHRRKDGTTFPIEFNAKWVRLDRDYIVTTVRDITTRKRAEEALRASEEKYHGLFEGTRDAIMTLEPPSWRFTSGNPAAVKMFGARSEKEFLSLGPGDVSPECQPHGCASLDKAGEMIETAMREGSHSFAWTHRRIGGAEFPADVLLTRVEQGRMVKLHATVRDITDRKQAEQVLMESERRFREMLENVELIAMTLDTKGRVTFCNDSLMQTTGWTREEIIGADWCGKFIPDELETQQLFFDMIEVGKIPPHHENPIQTKNGKLRTILWNNTMLRDAAGNYIGVASIGQDVTERRRAEEALRESEQRLRQVVETIREVFWMVDLSSNQMIYVSPGYESIWGRTCESLYASPRDWVEAIHPDDRERIHHSYEAHATAGTYDEEFRIQRPDGQERWIRDRGFPVKDENGTVYRIAGVAEDITERKKLEQQFLRAQRMESIGTLAGGIAHDLNNVLGPIIMSLDLLKMRFPEPESQELLGIVGASAQRGADMVRQVLSFARGVEGRRMEVQVKHLIHEIEKIANDTFLKNIQVRTSIPHDLWLVVGDPTQLHQVLLNLCVNARDAMPLGGTLAISAENRILDAQYASLNLEARQGPYVFIQVEDSGMGIPADVLKKIFDPFFTTKEVGKGTGLGLSTTMAIMKSHGGFIQVSSEVGIGTKFSLYLPAQTEAFGSAPVAIAADIPRGHGELILIIDDETSVRQITQQTLQAFGYRVVLACDGAEALSVYATQGAEIAAVLTDMTMPVMDGIAAIRVLLKMNPAVRIIGTSGLSTRGYATEAAALGVKYFLQKPYTAETLLKALKELLPANIAGILD